MSQNSRFRRFSALSSRVAIPSGGLVPVISAAVFPVMGQNMGQTAIKEKMNRIQNIQLLPSRMVLQTGKNTSKFTEINLTTKANTWNAKNKEIQFFLTDDSM